MVTCKQEITLKMQATQNSLLYSVSDCLPGLGFWFLGPPGGVAGRRWGGAQPGASRPQGGGSGGLRRAPAAGVRREGPPRRCRGADPSASERQEGPDVPSGHPAAEPRPGARKAGGRAGALQAPTPCGAAGAPAGCGCTLRAAPPGLLRASFLGAHAAAPADKAVN